MKNTDDSLFIAGLIESTGIGWEGKNKQGELIALYILNKENESRGYKKMNENLLKSKCILFKWKNIFSLWPFRFCQIYKRNFV